VKHQRVTGLFYITHIDNIPSLLEKGILSHEQIVSRNIQFTPIYDEGIVSNRRDIHTPDGRTLWNFTNLYFQARNPMLYRVLHEKPENEIAVISVQPNVLGRPDIYVSTGNAAHSSSNILNTSEMKKALRQIIRDTVGVEWWNDLDGSKRKIMAECLVPDMLPPDYIQSIYVANHTAKEKSGKNNPTYRASNYHRTNNVLFALSTI